MFMPRTSPMFMTIDALVCFGLLAIAANIRQRRSGSALLWASYTASRGERHALRAMIRQSTDPPGSHLKRMKVVNTGQTINSNKATVGGSPSYYGNFEEPELICLQRLEEENRKLKRIVADQALEIQALKAMLSQRV